MRLYYDDKSSDYFLNVQAGQLNYVAGSHVWLEDPELAWIDGEIQESNKDEVTIIFESGTRVSLLNHIYVSVADTQRVPTTFSLSCATRYITVSNIKKKKKKLLNRRNVTNFMS